MVAIKNLSIASAVLLSVADQGLAAPINTRAPKKGIKTGLAHHALSVGGQVGAAFAGARRDVEERSPKKGIKTGFAHHALSVAGNVGAAFAGNARRDVEERSPKKGIKTGFAHHALSVAGQVGSAFAGGARDVEDLDERDFEEELDERDIDELYELATRSPKKGIKTGFAHHALSVAGNVGAAFAGNARRDVDELDERDFDEELDERDFDEELDERDVEEFEIYTRSPRKGIKTGLAHHALSVGGQVGAAFAGGARRDVDELDERDIDELYELATRSPKKGIKTGFAHHALSVAGQVGSAFAGGARRDIDDEELVARALEELDERDVEDIYARYFDDAEDFEY